MASLHPAIGGDGSAVGAAVVLGTGDDVIVGNAVDVGTIVGIRVGCSVSAAVGSCVSVGDATGNVVGRNVGITDPPQRLQVFLHFSCTTAGGSHPSNVLAQS